MIVFIRATGNCVNFPAPLSELLIFSAILDFRRKKYLWPAVLVYPQFCAGKTGYQSFRRMRNGRLRDKENLRWQLENFESSTVTKFWHNCHLIVKIMEENREEYSAVETQSADGNSQQSQVLQTDRDLEDQQNARASLREKFLRLLFASCNKPACFSMHERTLVQGIFRGTDIDMENLQVSELQTPMGVLSEALLRSSDVLSFTVDFEAWPREAVA